MRGIEAPKIALTIDVEHLYCKDFEGCMRDLYDFLEEKGIGATMFFLGRTALNHPEILEEAYKRGHEIGCHGFDHTPAHALHQEEFHAEVKRSKEIIEQGIGQSISGFRSPRFSITSWLLPQLKTLGFRYDSSVYPCLPIITWYGLASAPHYPYHPDLGKPQETDATETFLEFPLAVFPGFRLPAGGGWWLRNLGTTYCLLSLSRLLRKGPAVLYFHPWEFTDQLSNPAGMMSSGAYFGLPLKFRRTGIYVFKLIELIKREFSPQFVTISELTDDLAW